MWAPEDSMLVTIDMDVDIHVPGMYLSMVYTILQQSDMEHEYVIKNICREGKHLCDFHSICMELL